MSEVTVKPFSRQGNFTVFDNAILDEVMPKLNHTSWKVLCFIMRQTLGWQKDEDGLSYSQIQEGTGIKSPTTVSKALSALRDEGIILAIATEDRWEATLYRINRNYEVTTTKNDDTPQSVVEPTTKNGVDTTTENEVGPTTENGDTKERGKTNKNNQGDGGAFAEAITAYQNNIAFTYGPLVAEDIGDAVDHYPDGWVVDAIGIAAKANKRSWSYVQGILRNWERKGYQDTGPAGGNGHKAEHSTIANDESGGAFV